MKVLFAFFLVLIQTVVFGSTITSTAIGNWSSASTWSSMSRTGTISTSTASKNITGSGTSFTTELAIGSILYKNDGITLIGTVASITNNTSLTLVANAAITISSQTYMAKAVPTVYDDVVISSGITVTLDTNASANSISISGKLALPGNSSYTLNTQLVVVTSSGIISFDHSYLYLLSTVSMYLQNGSNSLGGVCNNNDEIFVGNVQYGVCKGGGALYTFAQIETAGGVNIVTAGAISTDQTICSGSNPVTLTSTTDGTGSGTITYEWQTNATGSYVTINAATASTYLPPALTSTTSYQRRTVSLIGGKTFYSIYTNPVKVTVNALPTITSVSAPATICKGSSATINLASIMGTGSSYNLYSASSGGTLIGTIPQAVSPTTSTTYYVEAVSLAGCVSSTRNAVTVSVYSLVDNTGTGFSSSSFCPGNQATITFDANNGSGVLPYTVSYRNDATLAISSQTIVTDSPTTINLSPNPTSTTHYTLLSITDANGCVNSYPTDSGAVATILATPAAPSASLTQPICAIPTGTITVTAPTPAAGITYTVTGTSPVVTAVTNTTGLFSGLAAGNYSVTTTNGSGCTSSPYSLVINPLVLITNTYTSSWDNGTPNGEQNIVFDGTFSSTGDLTACSCLVKSGRNVTINPLHTLTITNAVTVEPTGILKFKSDLALPLSSSASLVQKNMVSNSGNIIYERYTDTNILNTDYTYWASPVVGFTLGGVSPNTLVGMFYSFDDLAQNWKQESSATAMTAGRGYIIRGPEAASPPVPPNPYLAIFTGVPNNGVYSITGLAADSSYLIGNPYPSAINADTFLQENSGILGTLYFWTHNTPIQLATNITDNSAGSGAYAYTSDDYASYNSTGGVATKIGNTSGGVEKVSNRPTGIIAAGQGFFASSLVSCTATAIVFNNDIRVTGTSGNSAQFFKRSNTKSTIASSIEKDRIWLNVTNTQVAFKQTLVGYITDATNDFDDRFDGQSFDGNEFIDFYSVLQDKNLTIQGRALPFDEKDVVPLGFRSSIEGTFAINIDQVDGMLINQAVFIEDKLTNTTSNLKINPYTFTTLAGTFNDRFVLHYINKTLATPNFDTPTTKVLVSNKNKQIKVNAFTKTIDSVSIYDLLGKQIYQKTDVDSNEWSIANLVSSHQILVVKTTLQNGITVTDKIIY